MEKFKELQLRERNIIPTNEILEGVLANNYTLYETFQDMVLSLDIEQNWQWYTPHKSWYAKGQYFWISKRGTKKEKTIYWLYVYDGYFIVSIWFKENNRVDLLNIDITEKTKQVIKAAKTEMGLPTFPVVFKITNKKSFLDIYTLIEYKIKIDCK